LARQQANPGRIVTDFCFYSGRIPASCSSLLNPVLSLQTRKIPLFQCKIPLLLQITVKPLFRPAIPLKRQAYFFHPVRRLATIPLLNPVFFDFSLFRGKEQEKPAQIHGADRQGLRVAKSPPLMG
jgi:hypothetical protein